METNTGNSYSLPVARLLTYGEPEVVDAPDWPNYLALGLGPEHISDLLRMLDEQIKGEEDENLDSSPAVHAWRALGQLHAEAAIEPLLTLFHTQQGSEWAAEEIPDVFGMIGPVALPAVAAYIADDSRTEWARINAMGCIEKIGASTPEARADCIEILSKQLERFQPTEYEFNAFLILALAKSFKAVEAAPLIARVFEADAVDEGIIGDWEDIQEILELLPPEQMEERRLKREESQKRFNQMLAGDFSSVIMTEEESRISMPQQEFFPLSASKIHGGGASAKKTKKKMAKQSRKKNRKR